MEAVISQSKRKLWVIVNYAALALLLILFYTAEQSGLTTAIWAGGAIALLLFVISFVRVYAQTRLWRFVHTSANNLDEREMMVTYESLRISYGAFTVLCLAAFLISELARERFLGDLRVSLMPVIAALIYVAHTLPASVIAWSERKVYRK